MSQAIIAKKAELVNAVAEQMKACNIYRCCRCSWFDSQNKIYSSSLRNLRGAEVEYKVIKTQSCVVLLSKLVLRS